MDGKKRCDICNLEVSKTNWSKHIKTKKLLDAVQEQRKVISDEVQAEQVQIKHCGICNVDVPEND
jgi:hypothetical protein